MDFLSDPRLSKFLTGTLAVLLLVFVAVLLMVGFVLYGVVSPASSGSSVDPKGLPGNPSLVTISGRGIAPRDGVFFPGQTSAPTIILAHGYRSSRNDVLTLAIALQENKYNVFLFNFSGHGETGGMITFGYKEARELLAAVQSLAQRGDVDSTRFGVFGKDIGGYAALAAAAGDGRIRAVVVDSVYDKPLDMLRLQVERSGVGGFPLVGVSCRWGFRLLTLPYRKDQPVSQFLPSLAGAAKLFIQSRDKPGLAESTLQLFLAATGAKQQTVVAKSTFSSMSDEEKRAYEMEVVNFFLQNLPPTPKAAN